MNYNKLTLGKGTQLQVLPSKCRRFLVMFFQVGQSYPLPSELPRISPPGLVALQLWGYMLPPFFQDRIWLTAEGTDLQNGVCVHGSSGALDPTDSSGGSSLQDIQHYLVRLWVPSFVK